MSQAELVRRTGTSRLGDFGPVAVLIPFKGEADGVLQGNETTYGLGARVWTRDLSRADNVARAPKAGSVWVNCYGIVDPISSFGGYKQSGFGRELSSHSIDLYTQIKPVSVKTLSVWRVQRCTPICR
jgi:acyl-CoA reductase-like NAD-dependent aldehyde dehydrogenase